ncbi:antitoxin VapB family protein [Candidatus Woesearchaeota archaeon]|nr:antitoxin VapB family protein [Candidatus Woesearchaeota archaeon]
MATKTITVTENAYEAVKSLKERSESFSELFLRITKRKPLSSFFGVLGKESGEKLELAVKELRKKRNKAHQLRLKRIVEAFGGK